MKAKSLMVVLVVIGVLFLYCVFCYRILNNRIEDSTRSIISNYFYSNYPQVTSYEYLKAISEEENTFQVFVKTNEDYYTFLFQLDNKEYQLLNAHHGVPSYIR